MYLYKYRYKTKSFSNTHQLPENVIQKEKVKSVCVKIATSSLKDNLVISFQIILYRSFKVSWVYLTFQKAIDFYHSQ